MLKDAIWQDEERMSGATCFRNTRVPIQIMFEYLKQGRLEEFFQGYPNVSRDQVAMVLASADD